MQLESPFAVDELLSDLKHEVVAQLKEVIKIEIGLRMKDQVAREVQLQLVSRTGEDTQDTRAHTGNTGNQWAGNEESEEMSPNLLEQSP